MLISAHPISISPFARFFSSSFNFCSCFLPAKSLTAIYSHEFTTVRGISRRNYFVIKSKSGLTNGVPDNWNLNKRKIVEHIFLLKAKGDISDVEEKDLLDYLYTSQYHMSGILAISLGRIEGSNAESFTHAVFMRFQKKDEIAKFYNSEFYARVLKDYVTPFSYGSISMDFESEVEDDIIPIFRRGEDFNYGVECILVMSVSKTAQEESIEDALTSLETLIGQYSSFIVQATIGKSIDYDKSEYSHAAIIRFPSREDFAFFKNSIEYKDMWKLKFDPIIEKALMLHYSVDPVGTELM